MYTVYKEVKVAQVTGSFSRPAGNIQGLYEHFHGPYLVSSTFKGLEFLKLNSSTFKDFLSML